jgi:MoxR-like ATPase
MQQEILNTLGDLDDVVGQLRHTFVAKDELVELLVTCAVAQEHLLIVGPPGTAKSELIKRFALLCSPDPGATAGERISYFEYLLTRFTEPNEIFGAVIVAAFGKGEGVWRDTRGMLPRAEIAFLDEVFKSNSAILNALLTILNERVFYNGNHREQVPLIAAVGATNSVPDDAELAALYDRFLLRVWTDNVEETLFPELFDRGWSLERQRIAEGYGMQLNNVTTTDALRRLHRALEGVDLEPVARPYREAVRRIRAEGIHLSDRRVIKLLKLIAASALRHKRDKANPGDFWVLKHVWNDPEQIPHLQAIVDPYVQEYEGATWSAERSPAAIEEDVAELEGRRDDVRTDADVADFLQQAEGLRRELGQHSSGGEGAADADRARQQGLLARLTALIDHVMQRLGEDQ